MPKNLPGRIARGTNLSDCIKFARQLGAKVESVHGTGEIRFSHLLITKSVTVNSRRKDAPRALTTWLNDLLSAPAWNAAE